MKNTTKTRGFTLVEIMIVVAIIGLLAAIAIPNFVQARTTSQKNACINNLRQVESAKEQYALENGKNTGDSATEANLSAYIKGGAGGSLDNKVFCPLDSTKVFATSYTISLIGTDALCKKDATHKL